MNTELTNFAQEIAEANVELVTKLHERFEEITDPRIQDIVLNFFHYPSLTQRQAAWLEKCLEALQASKPLYGDFKAIEIMFMIAGEHMKTPKIRLMTSDDIYVELWFTRVNAYDPSSARLIKVFRDGWQGHGKRKFIATITEGLVKVRWADMWTQTIMDLLQDFSLDPAKVAKASSKKLGACSFCAQRLSDPESKERGYGPVCAEHYHLPWGERDEKAIAYEKKVAELPVESLL